MCPFKFMCNIITQVPALDLPNNVAAPLRWKSYLKLLLPITLLVTFSLVPRTTSHLTGLPWSCQFSSVAQLCPTLCSPMNRSTSGLPVHHQLPESTQTHVHRVGDAIQPSHPLSSPFSCPQSFPALGPFPMSQFFAWGGQSIGVSASTSLLPMNTQEWPHLSQDSCGKKKKKYILCFYIPTLCKTKKLSS